MRREKEIDIDPISLLMQKMDKKGLRKTQ